MRCLRLGYVVLDLLLVGAGFVLVCLFIAYEGLCGRL
jgi:hypothetical protein